MKPEATLVITDLDNTLWDWVEMWSAGFEAMLSALVSRSGVTREVLESEIRAVYRVHGTSEYAFLIENLPSLQALHPGECLPDVYDDAIHAYSKARNAVMHPYPGVVETLERLRLLGCPVIAYTESMWFYSMRRVKRTGLDGLLQCVYSPPDHATPSDLHRYYEQSEYALEATEHRTTPPGEKKPNPLILLDIVNDSRADPSSTVYVGDNLLKDVGMAQDAGVLDVYAKYGLAQHRPSYDVLRRVTHWQEEDVEREKRSLVRSEVVPTYTLETSFAQLLDLFDFRSPTNRIEESND